MSTPIGRTKELDRIAAVLEDGRRLQVARTCRLIGSSGIGKSTVASASVERARAAGWLALLEPAHRIQASLPLAVARRIGAGILAALGERGALFAVGLPSDFTTERDEAKNEEALYRLIEAVLLDFPLLVAVDDMQWCDPESLSLLLRLIERFSDQRFVLLSIERLDEPGWDGLAQSDVSFVLDALAESDARALARSLLPDASDEAIARIAEISAGRAIDIVAIAESLAQGSDDIAGVAAGLRAVVARDLAVMTPERREFLQMLALMEEPIPIALLQLLWSDDHFLPLLQASTGRYLTSAPAGIAFRHAALAQATRETIAIDIPYRRRILAAISKLAAPSSSDLEQAIAQARACGDTALEREYLERLAAAAEAARDFALQASALERLLPLIESDEGGSIATSTMLSNLYNGIGDERKSLRVSREALARIENPSRDPRAAQLIASLLLSTWHTGARDGFDELCARFNEPQSHPAARAVVTFARMVAATSEFDEEAYLRARALLPEEALASPLAAARLKALDTMVLHRGGTTPISLPTLAVGDSGASPVAAIMATHVAFLRNIYTDGAPGMNDAPPSLVGTFPVLCARALAEIASGRFDDAIAQVHDSLLAVAGTYAGRALVGLAASAAAIGERTLPRRLGAIVESEGVRFLSEERNFTFVPIACAFAALDASKQRDRARAVLERAIAAMERRPPPLDLFPIPVVASIAAQRLGDEDLLERLASGAMRMDRQRWSLAMGLLARLHATRALRRRIPDGERAALSDEFTALGAPFFAAHLLDETRTGRAQIGALRALSRREREITALIAEGLSNRAIAERLVLSERTVEGHIANAFGKAGASSRAQLAAWYIRAFSAA
ncbi:MAG: helix-turn-helix domain-containing protein [Candidatus Eremiobacteraeota bacterium]|nr:helix-turn-helix domain-containing protein [Candidatus Eremiobacteraeota bacterium]